MLRLAAQAPRRWRPLSANVRQLKNRMRALAASVLTLALGAWRLALGAAAQAATAPAAIRTEIEALLVKLQSSGCEFNRNGNWYTGADARTHLLRKLEYLENETTLRSTEQFIELAATSSSTSGQAYQVKCSGDTAVPSAQWLTNELAAARAASRQSASAPK